MKIDAEVCDLKVLKGALLLLKEHRIKALQFEYNHAWLFAGDTLHEALRLLEDLKYQVWVLRHDGLYEFSYAKLGEFFRYAMFVACVPDLKPIAGSIVRGKIC